MPCLGDCFDIPSVGRGVPYMSQKKILRDFVYRVVSICIYKLISSVGIIYIILEIDLSS